MIKRYLYKDTVWIDLINPSAEEIAQISEEFRITPGITHELVSPSFKSRVDVHKDYIYMILHFPVFKHSQDGDSRQEVDFVIGKNFLITTRYESIDAMETYAKVVEVNSILDRGFPDDYIGVLFFGIIHEIYQSLFYELEYIESSLIKIERGIFSGQEKEMVVHLSEVSRNLINFRKATDFHSEVLASLDHFGGKLFGEQFSYHVQKVIDEYRKVANSLHNNMEFVNELRETNNSLLSTKQNEIMKTLTIMAFVTFPLTLISSVFGMNALSTPIIGMKGDFWYIIGIMVSGGVGLFAYFKHKKWF